MNNLSTDDREYRFDGLDVFLRDGKIIVGERNEISQLTRNKRAFLSAFAGKPTAALSVEPQCFLAAEAILFRIHRNATDGFSSDQPIERDPRVVTRHTRGIRARADRNPKLQHFPNRWRSLRGL